MERIVAWHFTDPGCPWAYSARPALARLAWRFGEGLDWRLVLIGLSENGEKLEGLGYTAGKLTAAWGGFSERFGMPFGLPVKPRLTGTARACRAVIAARELDPALGEAALGALQLMQFTSAGLLDEDDDLRAALASVPGLDAEAIVSRLEDPDLLAAYEADRHRARRAEGRPAHVQNRHADGEGRVRYTAPSLIFERADGRSLEVGGFQPFESYDTALANLAPELERRGAPTDAGEVLAAFPAGLTTAEVAAVMRPSDLIDADLAATKAALIGLAEAGDAICEPFGDDALWRAAADVAGADEPAAAATLSA